MLFVCFFYLITAHSITHNRFADDFLDDTLYHSKITAINSKNTPFMTAHNTFLYPYNLNVTQISPTLDNILSNAGPEMDKHESRFIDVINYIKYLCVCVYVCTLILYVNEIISVV